MIPVDHASSDGSILSRSRHEDGTCNNDNTSLCTDDSTGRRCVALVWLFRKRADRLESENTKKSLLGFSLRPSMRGRASSNNVPTTTHGVSGNPTSHSTTTATTTSAPQPPPAAAAPATSTSRTARRRSIPQNATAEPSTRTRSRATVAEDGTHGTGASGGCKCAIM